MNFALLGDDPAALPLVRAIALHSDHRLTNAALIGPLQRAVQELVPDAAVHDDWESLLLDRGLDAVIVGGADTAVHEGTRQLAAGGTALLVLPHAAQGSTFAYELALARDDTGVRLFPVIPRRVHPLVVRLREQLAENRFGRLLHVQLERELPSAMEDAASMPLSDVDQALLLDVDLLRDVGGDYDQVTSLRSGQTAAGVAMAAVTLAGQNLPEATWTARPGGNDSRWRLKLTGERGTATLSGGSNLSQVRLETGDGEQISEPSTGVTEIGDALVRQFERAVAGESFRPDWSDLTRAFEIVDASHRSVARRRTIDLHFEETSERNQFKSQMAALGCGLLMLTLAGVVVLLIAGALFNIPAGVMQVARVFVFLPLFLFLALQVLVLIARPSQDAKNKSSATGIVDDSE